MTKVNQLDFTGNTIFCGLDVHKLSWRVNIRDTEFELKDFTQKPNANELHKHLTKNYPGAKYKVGYEAGFCGFGIQRELSALGIDCVLLNAADIGLVFTQPDVSVCPFPSKTVDYMRAHLPILAAVEHSGDYAHIIQNEIKAGLACPADDKASVSANLERLATDPDLRHCCGKNGYDFFIANMTSDRIAERILKNT